MTILDEYQRDHGLYSDFTQKLDGLIRELLKQKGVRVHSITSRAKDPGSLQGKLNSANGKYSSLRQITDLAALRIITYYNDEVDAIAEIMEQEFEIDSDNSVDKRKTLDPDRFGYLSLHYVGQLPAKRLELTEYARFEGLKFEIQIRSILQHTWAEIEHDMGYKSEHAVPKDIRRSFSRLAGLLELADIEFARIREQLTEYEQAVPKQIDEKPAEVLIDQASLKSFILNSAYVKELDIQIAALAGVPVVYDENFFGEMAHRLHYLGVKTISDVVTLLHEHRDVLLRFVAQVFRHNRVEAVVIGSSLFQLSNVLIGKTGSRDHIRHYLLNTSNFVDRESIERLVHEILVYVEEAL
ncbi:(p)ppGpp synthetase [Tumebacillus sp. DT12]|uniref:(P)ppGpp synthetase n=1 Tax=Tumebacillus lacus TaxID=2995335 RepID=A0ABT3X3X1_9BACL|nr:(p)ppGpp synthetase [Tumebacillus lacus]MCX7571592.1 (p)ppGpp synthetase [Tumebacillus lacus]